MRATRRSLIATTATLLVATVGAVTVLAVEARVAAGRSYVTTAPPGDEAQGDAAAPALRLAVLGDSTAVGLGASRPQDTVGGRLARAIAATGRRVSTLSVAVSGARTGDLAAQVDRVVTAGADLAVVLIGANDATHLTGQAAVRNRLGAAVARLRGAGVRVVVGTCPDLGAARSLAQPLRLVAAWQGRRVARSEQDAVARAGGVAVDIGARTGAAFRADRATLSADAFHPSALGYRLWAEALGPAVLAQARLS